MSEWGAKAGGERDGKDIVGNMAGAIRINTTFIDKDVIL
jgi:hypothetical protein